MCPFFILNFLKKMNFEICPFFILNFLKKMNFEMNFDILDKILEKKQLILKFIFSKMFVFCFLELEAKN